jgi:hypothetical protein
MKFNSIISAAKHAGKQNVYNSYKLLAPFIPSVAKTILKSTRGTKDMYVLLIRNNIVSNGQKEWEEILALGLDETKWREIFKLPFIVIQNTKLQWLIQYRINQRILGTNKFLYKIKVKMLFHISNKYISLIPLLLFKMVLKKRRNKWGK